MCIVENEFSSARERTYTPNVLQCVAVYSSVLQCVAACCNVFSVLQYPRE